ncbi:hypothetical protein [Crocinitomix catalasitica]|nr:hypothetical protein [Crocinitomix catalasitica]
MKKSGRILLITLAFTSLIACEQNAEDQNEARQPTGKELPWSLI